MSILHNLLNKASVLIVLLLVCVLASCKKPESPAQSVFNSYDRTGMLTNIGNNIIIPSYTSFAKEMDSLYLVAQQFSDSADANTLVTLQNQWWKAYLAWKYCEVFDFGPAYNNGYNDRIQYTDNYTMTFRINPSFIESTVSKTPTTYDSTFVPAQSLSLTGLSAVEYLLYDTTSGGSSVLAGFTGNTTASTQRMNYLVGLIQSIRSNAHSLLSAWQPSGGGYVQTFISANGNDVNSSISFLVIQIETLGDYVKNNKIGDPIGAANNTLDATPICPTCVETYYSNHAFDCITANYQSINNVFFGIGNNGITSSSSFSGLLNSLSSTVGNELLSTAVLNKMDTINIEITAFKPTPLQQAVTSSDAQVTALFNTAKQLLVLLKIDMANSLGVQVPATDKDGD